MLITIPDQIGKSIHELLYLLLKLVNQKCNSKLSLHQMLTLVAANLMSRRNIHDLLLQKEPEKPPEINTNQLCLGIC